MEIISAAATTPRRHRDAAALVDSPRGRYGVSFLTQSFAGGRACADMLYSGHTSVAVFSVICGAKAAVRRDYYWYYLVSSLLLCLGCFKAMIDCHDHYTVDVVLAAPIATLLATSPYVDVLAQKCAAPWRRVERYAAGKEA